ncbi:hypothetical protein D3C72_935050 [compost metagenome]
MPVGGETLDLVEAVMGDIRHGLQGEPDDAIEDEPAQHHAHQPKRHNDDEGAQRPIAPIASAVTAGNGIDDLAGKDRHHHFGQRASNHQHDDETHQRRPIAPMVENKAEHIAICISAEIELLA